MPIKMFHMMLSMRMPEMAISDAEADQLSEAMVNYYRHSNTVVSQKTMDLMALCYVVAMVEGTRLIAVVNRTKHDAAQRKAQQSEAVPNVVRFDPATGQMR